MSDTETVKDIQTISTEELAAKLDRREKFEFWNVLTSQYYSNENIAGSRHVPLDTIGREVAGGDLPKDTEIVVYCAGPQCPQSGMAVEKLLTYGYTNVKAYEGGLEEWEEAGLPIEQDAAAHQTNSIPAKVQGASCH
jgi:rhodanese-related sulfurtransferase